MDTRTHWETVYQSNEPTRVSWHQAHLHESLLFVRRVAPLDARVLDVGGGASTFVDDLLATGYTRISVLDVSDAALNVARRRLGERSRAVNWIRSDITTVQLEQSSIDIWHDRAVFHFLTREADRGAYVARLSQSLRAGGHAIISTFAVTGPEKCSGLDVVRYSAARLHQELGESFELCDSLAVTHVTPSGSDQDFLVCLFGRR